MSTPLPAPHRRRFLWRAPVLAALCVPACGALAVDWDGGGGDNLFGTGANWVGDVAPTPGLGTVLTFTGATRLTPDYNYANGDNFGEWRLAGTSSFTIGSSTATGFGLDGKIETNAGSTGTLTLLNTIAGIYARSNIEINPVGGSIVIGAPVFLDNNAQLDVFNGGAGAQTLTISGALDNGNGTGGNGSLVLNQTSTVILTGANDYGSTTLNNGTTLRVGNAGASGTLGQGGVTNNGTLQFARTDTVTVGNVISGSGLVQKTSTGTLNLTGANTYTGITTISAGTLNVASLSNYGAANSSIGARTLAQETAAGDGVGIHLKGGALQYTGSTPQSTDRNIRIINGTSPTIDASGTGAGTLSFTKTGANINLFDTPGTRTLNLVGSNTGNNSFSIRLENQGANQTALRKAGAGKWVIANTDSTYTGETIIAGGILNVASLSNYGAASSIGARTLAEENATVTGVGLHFMGGTLQYTGSTPQSTDRHIRMLNGNGATIDASGSVPSATLSFTRSGANVNLFDTAGTRTLTLTGSNTGDNTFAITLENQGGSATSLSKTGAGKWVLTGNNTHTGLTSITGGTLSLGRAGGTLADSAAVTVNGGTLDVAQSDTVGVVTLTTGTISGAGTLTLNGTNMFIADGTMSANLAGGGGSRLWIGGNTGATVLLGGVNSSTFTDTNSTIIGHSTTGAAGTVRLTSATSLGPSGQNTQLFTGTLDLNGQTGVTPSSIALFGGAAANLVNNAGTAASYANTVNLGGNLASLPNVGGTGTLTLGGTVTNGGLVKTGAGVLNLTGTANDYTGQTILSAGTVNVASLTDYGVNGSLGARASAQDVATNIGILFRGGSLQYTGSTPQSTDRAIRVSTTGGAIIDASGSVPSATLSFTAASSPDFFENGGARSLTFTGSNTGANTFNLAIPETGGATSVTKTGTGSWVLSGANSNTGAITVKQGTLTLNGNRTATSGAISVGDTAGQSAVLNLEAGAFAMNTSFSVGTGVSTVLGTVNQTGGSLTLAGNQLLVGNGTARGTYNLSAGTLNGGAAGNRGVILGVNSGSQGTFNLSGTGVLNLSGSNLQVGRSEASSALGAAGAFNQTGGTATVGTLGVGGADATANAGNIGGMNLTGGTFTATSINGFGGGNNSVAALNIGGSAVVTLPAFPTARGAGANTTILFDGGTLRAGNSSATYLENMTTAQITNNGLNFDSNGQTVTINQALANFSGHNGPLVKNGAGTLTLGGSAANTFTGGVTVNDGVLQLSKSSGNAILGNIQIGNTVGSDVVKLGASNQIADSSVLTFTAGAISGTSAFLQMNGQTETVAGIQTSVGGRVPVIENAGGGTGILTVNNSANFTFDGIIRNSTGVLGLTKAGAGTLILQNTTVVAPINYTGPTTVSGGTLRLELRDSSFASPVTNDATLELFRNAGGINFTPAIAGTGVLNKTGGGTISLFGNSTLSGTVNIAGGRLRQQHASALGAGTVNIGAGNYNMLWWNTGSDTAVNPYVLNGIGASRDGETKSSIYADGGGAGFGTYVLTGPVTLAATSDVGGHSTNHLALNGEISGPGGLIKDYLNITTLGGTAANTYGGVTTLKDGLLILAKPAGVNAVPGNLVIGDGVVNGTVHHGDRVQINASEQIPDTAFVTINSGLVGGTSGKLELNGFDETIAGLNGTANLAVVQVRETGAAGVNSTLTVNNAVDQNFAGIIRNNAGGASILSLTKGGAGKLTLSGTSANGHTGVTTVNAGTLELAKAGGNNAIGGNLVIGDGAGTDTVLWSANNMVADAAVITLNAGGIAQLNGKAETIGALQSTGGAGVVDNQTSTAMTLTLGGAFVAPNNASGSYSGTISETGGGAITLVKNGTGTQTLSGVNTYTGKTMIQGGVLEITSGNEATLGAPVAANDAIFFNGGTLRVSGANLTLNDPGRNITVGLGSGTLDVDSGRVLTIANPIFSSGISLQRTGGGTVNLTTTATISTFNISNGLVDIAGGKLVTDVVNVTGTGAFNWGNGRIEVLSKDTSTGTVDYSNVYQAVRTGTTVTFNGDLATDTGSVLALNRSPSIYLNNGTRFNNFQVNGDLDLSAAGDQLVLEISPYLLRPFSPALGSGANDFGSLPLVIANGGAIIGQFDLLGTVLNDGLGFDPFTGTFTSASALPVNTYYFQYADTNADLLADTLFFHYNVAGYVPEPGTLSMMLAGFMALRYVRTGLRKRRS